MSLVPLLWLGVLAFYGQRRSALWWTLALMLGLSWIANTATEPPHPWLDPWLVSAIYPLLQALLLGLVLLARVGALVALLLGTGITSLVLRTYLGPEVVNHTVAWTSIVVMVWPARDPARRTIALVFASMWLGWVAFTASVSWVTWGIYQGMQAAGLLTFCWASAPRRVRA